MHAIRRDFLPEDLAPELKANGIDACVAVQADSSENDTRFLLDLAEHDSRIAGVVGWVDLESPHIEDRLRFFSKFPKLRGFRHVAQAEPDNRFLVRPDFTRGVSLFAQLRFHLRHFDSSAAARRRDRISGDVPGTALRHRSSWQAGRPDENLDSLARKHKKTCLLPECLLQTLRAGYRGRLVSLEGCGLRAVSHAVFEAFGPDRLMFGSDWPVCLVAATYGKCGSRSRNTWRKMRPARKPRSSERMPSGFTD